MSNTVAMLSESRFVIFSSCLLGLHVGILYCTFKGQREVLVIKHPFGVMSVPLPLFKLRQTPISTLDLERRP